MNNRNGLISKEIEEQMWQLLAPCTEEDVHKSYDLPNTRIKATKPSRPLTGIKDNLGRDMVFRDPPYGRADALTDTKNSYDGGLEDGLPHGFGVKTYTKILTWQGVLLPYGSILETAKCGPGKLIPLSRYIREVGILHRFPGSIIVADDEDKVQSYEHCRQILERLRFVQKYGVAAILLVCADGAVITQLATEAMYSDMLEFFRIPVLAIDGSTCELLPKNYPDPADILRKLPELAAHPPSLDIVEEVLALAAA
jgi:hypothetical protein